MSESDLVINLSDSEIDAKLSSSLTNLKILSKLKSNNKLSFSDNKFSIDEWNYSQPLRRWWTQESRNNTLTHLETFIGGLFSIIDSIYSRELNEEDVDEYYPDSRSVNIFKKENSKILLQFVTEIGHATTGLNNLKRTYKNDTAIVSSLEIIIEKLDVRSRKIASILTLSKRQQE